MANKFLKKSLYKRFLLYFLLNLTLMMFLYVFFFSLQFGPYVSTEYWIKDAYSIKCHIAKDIKERKTVIAAGSNGLYSIDSALIEVITGIKTVNMSVHAGLSLDFILDPQKLFLKKNDIVLLPLEYSYYCQKTPFNNRTLEAMITWDKDFYNRLSLWKKIQLISSCSPLRVMAALIRKYLKKEKLHTTTSEKAISIARNTWGKNNKPTQSNYITKNLNQHGDILYNLGTGHHIKPDGYSGLRNSNWEISPYFKTSLTSFVKYCRNHKINLFITWPCTMKSNKFILNNPNIQRNISKINNFIQTLGIPILGRQEDFYFEKKYFFDTAYHLNNIGREIRSRRLASYLLSIIQKRKDKI